MMAFSAVAVSIPIAEAKTTITLSIVVQNQLGVNSAAEISVLPQPTDLNPLLASPEYKGKTSVWPDAVATFIRPDGTKDVVQGPFKTRPALLGRTTTGYRNNLYAEHDGQLEHQLLLAWRRQLQRC